MQFRVHLFLLCSDVIAGMVLQIERSQLRSKCIKHDALPTLSDWISAIDKIYPPELSSRICRIAAFVVSGTKIHANAEIAEYLTPVSITHPEAIPVGPDILLQDGNKCRLVDRAHSATWDDSPIFHLVHSAG